MHLSLNFSLVITLLNLGIAAVQGSQQSTAVGFSTSFVPFDNRVYQAAINDKPPKKTRPVGLHCLYKHFKDSHCKVDDAYHCANYDAHQKANLTIQGRAGALVSEYQTAATYLYLNQYGNATVTAHILGMYASSIIGHCQKMGFTAGMRFIPKRLYKAKGFHADDESVFVVVSHAPRS